MADIKDPENTIIVELKDGNVVFDEDKGHYVNINED